jgi:hypothetical protein
MRSDSSLSGPCSITVSLDAGAFSDSMRRNSAAMRQLVQAGVLAEVVVGTQAQAGDHVEIRVARGEEDDRQRGRLRAQLAAQVEAAFRLVAQADVDDHQLRQPRRERGRRLLPRAVAAGVVAEAVQRLDVVGADQRFVLDDGDAASHGRRFLYGDAAQRAMRTALAQAAHRRCPRFARSRRRFARRRTVPLPPPGASCAPGPTGTRAMNPNTPRPDANAELHHFEPLRVVLALGALLLALLLMLP